MVPMHCRYKMPRVIGKVEGKGNGIKTVIFNVTDLSMALKRDAGEVCKFFGTELGAQVSPSQLTLSLLNSDDSWLFEDILGQQRHASAPAWSPCCYGDIDYVFTIH